MAKIHTCKPELFEKDLSQKLYIVTGGNSGIGLETARQLARQGAEVLLACRRPDATQKAIRESQKKEPALKLSAMKLDLGHFASVRSFAKEFLSKHKKLDGLVNNAGVMNTPKQKTKDGFEMQFGTNHLGHFLLTELLLDALKAAPDARIVCVSSCYHDKAQGREGDIHFDDPNYETRKYDGWEAYAQSKLANLLHARELARRYEKDGIFSASVHPGWVRTNLISNTMPVWMQNFVLKPTMSLMGAITPPWMKMLEPWEGAQSSLHVLLSDDLRENNGAYFSQVGLYRDKKLNPGGWPMQSPNPNATDEKAKRLWELSAKLVQLEKTWD